MLAKSVEEEMKFCEQQLENNLLMPSNLRKLVELQKKADLEAVEEIREKLSENEHIQWEAWSKDIANNENISKGRFMRWESLWIPYFKLTEKQKDQDRFWADKTISLLKKVIKGEKQ